MVNKDLIYCIGDSHVCIFSGTNKIHPIWPQPPPNLIPLFKSYRFGPVLAYNLCKYGTKTQGREKLFSLLKDIPVGSKIMLCFGEIDCRAHLLKQAIVKKRDINSVVNECVDRYFSVILEIKKMNYDILIWHVLPSTKYDVINKNFPTFGSCRERNNVIILFNKRLSDLAIADNMKVISIFNKLIDENNSAKMEYYKDPIHLSLKALPLILEEIKQKIPDISEDVLNKSSLALKKLPNYSQLDVLRKVLKFGIFKLRNIVRKMKTLFFP